MASSAPRQTARSQPTSDTDYDHVVLGGWDFDSPRRIILQDLEALLQNIPEPFHSYIERTVVYGQRAQVGHFYLRECANPDDSADRFYRMQELFSNKTRNSSGSPIWWAPSRTPARRLKNRATRKAREAILGVWSTEPKPEPEIGWNKQIIWVDSKHVASISVASLYAQPSDKVIARSFEEDGEVRRFHFNVSVLKGLTGTSEAEIEI